LHSGSGSQAKALAPHSWRHLTQVLHSCQVWISAMRCALGFAVAASLTGAVFDWDIPRGFPRPAIPANNPMSAAKVELGRYLFYDTRMSVNGKESCGTCHRQELAFTDGRGRARGATGELHPRSSMSLGNVAYVPVLTWANPTITSASAGSNAGRRADRVGLEGSRK